MSATKTLGFSALNVGARSCIRGQTLHDEAAWYLLATQSNRCQIGEAASNRSAAASGGHLKNVHSNCQSLRKISTAWCHRSATSLSRRAKKSTRVQAVSSDPDYEPPAWQLKPEVPKEYWFAVTEANKMLLHGPELETVLRDAVERAERSNLPRNTWLIFEPAFLEEHPGLKGVKKDMKGQVAAIVSTNQDWMIQIVKPMLPGVVIGKFRFPSPYVKDPLASSIKASPNVPSGAGVWH